METSFGTNNKSRFPYIYELFIWFLYVSMFKYDYYLNAASLPGTRQNFPYPQFILYSIGITLYVIPFYRWLAPMLLQKKKYVLFFFIVIFYFGFVSKASGWLISLVFYKLNGHNVLRPFYEYQFQSFSRVLLRIAFWDLRMVVTDLIAFLSLTFMWYAFENERTKHLLEKDNLVLQLESLKAQLHPHFLFNTLNSIYGMSLTGNKETPAFILRLSDMMRYILYDCRHHKVPLEKDIEFLMNYIEMEKKRYPEADIQFAQSGESTGKTVAPLLFIPFIENSFKHGAHRVTDNGFIRGTLHVADSYCSFNMHNDFFAAPQQGPQYGGVGIENVKKRLQLYYPGKHEVTINRNNDIFEVELKIFY
jgi:sensor histidine kinase YesM